MSDTVQTRLQQLVDLADGAVDAQSACTPSAGLARKPVAVDFIRRDEALRDLSSCLRRPAKWTPDGVNSAAWDWSCRYMNKALDRALELISRDEGSNALICLEGVRDEANVLWRATNLFTPELPAIGRAVK